MEKESSKPPKVVHVVISMVVGGAERLVYDMVRYGAFADNPPAVCCMDTVGELGEKLLGEGYRVHCKGRKPGLDWSMILWLRDRIREEKADVVHAHQYSPLFYTVPAALLAGRVKVVYTEHGRFYPERMSWKRVLMNPLLALGVDHLVSISNSTAEAMAIYDNFPRDRIQVVHNGIDCRGFNNPIDTKSKRRELHIEEDALVLGTAARLDSIKNIKMMLRVLKLVLQQFDEAVLVIAGQGLERLTLQKTASELGIDDHVKFVGLRFDLPEVYKVFDLFVLTSFTEGISVTLLESMASGVPSVVTAVGGNVEIVVAGETGYTVPVDEDERMAGIICELLRNKKKLIEMGSAARGRAEKSFTIQMMMSNYLQCYGAGK